MIVGLNKKYSMKHPIELEESYKLPGIAAAGGQISSLDVRFAQVRFGGFVVARNREECM
jgi:hypothetical protein